MDLTGSVLRAGGEAGEFWAAACGIGGAGTIAGISGDGAEVLRMRGGCGSVFGGYAGGAAADEEYCGEDSRGDSGNYFVGDTLRHEAVGEFCWG